MFFRTKVKCPHCGREFTYPIFGFNSTVTCEKCNKKIYIETRTMIYMTLLVLFLFGSDYINAFLKDILPNQSEFVYIFAMLIVVLVSLLVVVYILVRLFGFTSVYRIRDDQYYKEVVNEAAKRRDKKK